MYPYIREIKQELPVSSRPVFYHVMCDFVVCFTGFKDKDYLVWCETVI